MIPLVVSVRKPPKLKGGLSSRNTTFQYYKKTKCDTKFEKDNLKKSKFEIIIKNNLSNFLVT